MHVCMYGWMDGWMDGCLCALFDACSFMCTLIYVCSQVLIWVLYIYIYRFAQKCVRCHSHVHSTMCPLKAKIIAAILLYCGKVGVEWFCNALLGSLFMSILNPDLVEEGKNVKKDYSPCNIHRSGQAPVCRGKSSSKGPERPCNHEDVGGGSPTHRVLLSSLCPELQGMAMSGQEAHSLDKVNRAQGGHLGSEIFYSKVRSQ